MYAPGSHAVFSPCRRRQAVAILAAAVAGVAFPAAARGDDAPPSNAAILQYVEQVPTSSGTSVPRGDKRRAALPSRVREQVRAEAGADAALLEEVATSPAYGAPQRTIPAPRAENKAPRAGTTRVTPRQPRQPRQPRAEVSVPDVGFASAVGGAVAGDDGRGSLLLFAVLAVVTSAAIAAAVTQRQNN